ncbi:MAG: hypothetical protein EA378_11600 [Phycisphaerales bacterium]|nr:MAG: hypothetical protein EA378_11600 [Phycisphaerales bacterium]
MGVLTRLGGVFKKKSNEPTRVASERAGDRAADRGNDRAAGGRPSTPAGVRLGSVAQGASRASAHQPAHPTADDVRRAEPPRPNSPVEVEARAATGESAIIEPKGPPRPAHAPTDALATGSAAPKNKQELLSELQKNYAEVVSLVRKVDQHLDAQDRRSARLMEIAESIPSALEALPAIRAESEKIGERLDALLHAQQTQSADAQSIRKAQVEALGDVRSLLESSREAEHRVAESLDQFRGTIGSMSEATGTLGTVLHKMRESDEKRDDRLAALVAGNNRAMMTVAGLVGVLLIIAVVIALVL